MRRCMTRWISSSKVQIRYLPRRRPSRCACRARRRRASAGSRGLAPARVQDLQPLERRPSTNGARWRRIVSTSGSSGIGGFETSRGASIAVTVGARGADVRRGMFRVTVRVKNRRGKTIGSCAKTRSRSWTVPVASWVAGATSPLWGLALRSCPGLRSLHMRPVEQVMKWRGLFVVPAAAVAIAALPAVAGAGSGPVTETQEGRTSQRMPVSVEVGQDAQLVRVGLRYRAKCGNGTTFRSRIVLAATNERRRRSSATPTSSRYVRHVTRRRRHSARRTAVVDTRQVRVRSVAEGGWHDEAPADRRGLRTSARTTTSGQRRARHRQVDGSGQRRAEAEQSHTDAAVGTDIQHVCQTHE